MLEIPTLTSTTVTDNSVNMLLRFLVLILSSVTGSFSVLPSSNYLEPASCFCPSFYVSSFKSFLENLSLLKKTFSV